MSPCTNTVSINTYRTNSVSCHPTLIQSASCHSTLIQSASTFTEQFSIMSPYTNTVSINIYWTIQYHVTLHQYSQHQHLLNNSVSCHPAPIQSASTFTEQFSIMSPCTNTVSINTYRTNSVSCHPTLIQSASCHSTLIQSASTFTEQFSIMSPYTNTVSINIYWTIQYHVTVHQYSQHQHLLNNSVSCHPAPIQSASTFTEQFSIMSPCTNTVSINIYWIIQYHVTLHQYSQHQHLLNNSVSCHPAPIQSASTFTEQFSIMSPCTNTVSIKFYWTIQYHVTLH